MVPPPKGRVVYVEEAPDMQRLSDAVGEFVVLRAEPLKYLS